MQDKQTQGFPQGLKFNRIDENRLYNGRNVYHIVINVSD